MNTDISNRQFFSEETDINNFTASLLNSCALHNLIPIQRLNEIGVQLSDEFIEYADRYTLRASSSVPVKTAEKIMGSLMFCCDVFLLGLNSVPKAIKALDEMKISEIIKSGQSLIWEYFNRVKNIQKDVLRTKINVPIYIYNHTMTECFNEFISGYNFRYEAQNIPSTIDYPLLFDTKYTQGVLYIHEYYSQMKIENELCGYYNSEEILWLFQGLSRKYRLSCDDLFVNIAETVLTNSLCAIALGKPVFSLKISKNECGLLQDKIRPFAKSECEEMFKEAMKQLCFKIKNPSVAYYVRPFASKLAKIIYDRADKNAISGYLVFDSD